jgi:hypothetical protein
VKDPLDQIIQHVSRHLFKATEWTISKGSFGVGLLQELLVAENSDEVGDGGVGQFPVVGSQSLTGFRRSRLPSVPKDVHYFQFALSQLFSARSDHDDCFLFEIDFIVTRLASLSNLKRLNRKTIGKNGNRDCDWLVDL